MPIHKPATSDRIVKDGRTTPEMENERPAMDTWIVPHRTGAGCVLECRHHREYACIQSRPHKDCVGRTGPEPCNVPDGHFQVAPGRGGRRYVLGAVLSLIAHCPRCALGSGCGRPKHAPFRFVCQWTKLVRPDAFNLCLLAGYLADEIEHRGSSAVRNIGMVYEQALEERVMGYLVHGESPYLHLIGGGLARPYAVSGYQGGPDRHLPHARYVEPVGGWHLLRTMLQHCLSTLDPFQLGSWWCGSGFLC
jgi:hypothetical protein